MAGRQSSQRFFVDPAFTFGALTLQNEPSHGDGRANHEIILVEVENKIDRNFLIREKNYGTV